MVSYLTHTQCTTALTLKRTDNMRSQTLRNLVLKGKKVRKMSGWVENEIDVEVRKDRGENAGNLFADLERVDTSKR